MESVKNYQSNYLITKMYEQAFALKADSLNISKLHGGLKNAVYLIDDGLMKCVLKIASNNEKTIIYVDRNTFWWEIKMLKLMEKVNIPSPKLLYYDDSLTLCNSPYFFMTYIDGENYLKCKELLSEEEKRHIEYQIGLYSYEITKIKMPNFYSPSFPQKKFNSNYDFMYFLFEKLIQNGLENHCKAVIEQKNEILNILKKYKNELNDKVKIKLCHTDIWDGNILIKNGKVIGIVDFSDLYVCDELMTFYFHTIDGVISSSFLEGYNQIELNTNEKIRIEIYRMYVILKMIVDCCLKKYGDFDWMYKNLNDRITNLKEFYNNFNGRKNERI